MRGRGGPPRWLDALLERVLGTGPWAQGVLGDLSEAYHRMRRRRPRLVCDLWYAGQAASLVLHRLVGSHGGPSAARAGTLAADARWALRVSLRRPLLTLAIVATLALGLGANAAVFSVIDGTFRATDWWADEEATLVLSPGDEFSRGQLWVWRQEPGAFETLGLYRLDAVTLAAGEGADPASVSAAWISPGLFAALRVRPVLGRGFLPGAAEPGGEATVIVSHGFWQREMGGDPGAVGSRILVNGEPRTVVGVQGPGGTAPGHGTDVWLPVVLDPNDPELFPDISYTLVGVLRDGADAAAGRTTLRALGRSLSERFPFFYRPDYLQGATVRPARAEQRGLLETPLFLLLGGTGLLLLIAVLNVGNMLVARAVERRRELAVRRALGAEKGRLVRQLATEGALLALAGSALGVAVAGPAASALAGLFPADVAVVRSAWTSPAVAAFVALSAVAAWAVLAGVPVAAFLAGERRSVAANVRPASMPSRLLVVVQSGLATVLLAAAVLLVQSVENLRDVPLGFEPEGVTALYVSPPESLARDRDRLRSFQEEAVRRAGTLPGVAAAGMTATLPLDQLPPTTPVNPRDARVEAAEALRVDRFAVDRGFFEAMGVRLESGRLFGSTERAGPPSAVVVNRALAERLWPGEDPVGRSLAIDPHAWDRFLPVVGVVEDFRSDGLVGAARPAVFVSLYELPARRTALVVRAGRGGGGAAGGGGPVGGAARVPGGAAGGGGTTGGAAGAPGSAAGGGAVLGGGCAAAPAGLVGSLRRAVREADPAVAMGTARSLPSVVRDAYGTAWVTMGLLAAMAVLATALAAVGIHAVLANHVARRRREIGVRLALGAEGGRVVGRVLGSGLVNSLVGVVLGTVVAALSVDLLGSLLFGVEGLSAVALAVPAAAVLAAAVLAALGPAVRAGRTAPAEVLREE